MFRGVMVAMVTPFKNGGKEIDEAKIGELVEFHIGKKTTALVSCGTTGESPTLSLKEHERVVEVVVEAVKGRIPVIAGTGSNDTAAAIHLTKHAQKMGVDGVLVVSPYYNRPSQEGLYRHFRAIAEAAGLPNILYNIQSRTGVNIEPETIERLARDCKNIVGVKEASGNLDQMSKIKILCGPDFDLISGDDSLTLPLLAIGGVGVISVVGNLVPQDMLKLIEEFERGNIKAAFTQHQKLFPLMRAMFIETNPVPVKTAMGMLGMIASDVRLPLCEMKPENKDKLRKAVLAYELRTDYWKKEVIDR